MDSWLALVVLYCAAGSLVYAITDTSDLASRVESRLALVPQLIVQEWVVFAVAALWPLWLAMRIRSARR
jgi:hypothetical protein